MLIFNLLLFLPLTLGLDRQFGFTKPIKASDTLIDDVDLSDTLLKGLKIGELKHLKKKSYFKGLKLKGLIMDEEQELDEDKLISVKIKDDKELKRFLEFNEEYLLDTWTPPKVGTVDIRVNSIELSALLQSHNHITIKLNNTSQYTSYQKDGMVGSSNDYTKFNFNLEEFNINSGGLKKNFHNKYHGLYGIDKFLKKLIRDHPKEVEKIVVGKSYEGRNINGIKIGKDVRREERNSTKKIVVFHGGQHAREWISTAVTLYLAEGIIQGNQQKGTDLYKILDLYNFIIIPVLNPDGYFYTWNNDRMWRKNLQPTPLPWCKGIDMNRNWDAHWGQAGASTSPCSEAYHGTKAFESFELKAMAGYLISHPNILIYIDFHAYSQLWMSPFAFNCNSKPKDFDAHEKVAKAAVSSIQTLFNTKFAQGTICNIIYQASGSSVDWAYEHANIKYSYGVELRDTGRYGFLLPPRYIIPSGQETLLGLTAMLRKVSIIENL